MAYQKLAKAFKIVNTEWMGDNMPSSVELREQFRLPLESLKYLEDHINVLQGLKKILHRLNPPIDPGIPLIFTLSGDEINALEKFISTSWEKFLSQHGFKGPTSEVFCFQRREEVEAAKNAELQLLFYLVQHPAVYDKSAIHEALVRTVPETTCIKQLNTLVTCGIPGIEDAILKNARCDDSIFNNILASKGNYPQPILKRLIEHRNFSLEIAVAMLDRHDIINYPELFKDFAKKIIEFRPGEQHIKKLLQNIHDFDMLQELVNHFSQCTKFDFKVACNIIDYLSTANFPQRELLIDVVIKAMPDYDLENFIQQKQIIQSNEKILSLLVAQCRTVQHINYLLEYDLSETILQDLISKDFLTPEQIEIIITKAKTEQTLELLYSSKQSQFKSQAYMSFYSSHALSAKMMMVLLEKYKANIRTILIFRRLQSQEKTQQLIELFGDSDYGLRKKAIQDILCYYETTQCQVDRQHWIQILMSLQQSNDILTLAVVGQVFYEEFLKGEPQKKLFIELLSLWGSSLLNLVPIDNVIKLCNEEEIKMVMEIYIAKKYTFTPSQLAILANKVTEKLHIENLLKHPNMSTQVAEQLFAKPQYHGKIGDWEWLQEHQILTLLNRAQDYDSLNTALSHNNLSKNAREQWVLQLKRDAIRPQGNRTPIQYQLEKLRVKACQHAVKALTDPCYFQVAKDSFGLYHTLKSNVESQKTPPQIKEDCIKAINEKRESLEPHRGYKQFFYDFLNALNYVCRFGYRNQTTGSWRFFEVPTATLELANNVANSVTEKAQEGPMLQAGV